MAKKKEAAQAADMLKSIRLEKVTGRMDKDTSMEISASINRKLWMVPAMRAVFCESRSLVDNKLVVTKLNMDRFYSIEFVPLEEDIVDPLPTTETSVEVSQNIS